MNKLRLVFFLGLTCFVLLGTNNTAHSQLVEADTIAVIESPVKIHSPHKATMYSVMLPGLGQAYNKKYWKIPILYAGIGATIYAINWNTKNYNKYKDGFRDLSQFIDWKHQDPNVTPPIYEEPASRSYNDIFTFDIEEESRNRQDGYLTVLKNKKDSFKHDRDLSYIILVGVYVLNIVDAAVDAHFTNFSVDDNLTIKVEPAVSYSAFTGNSIGFKCQITF